MKIKLFENYHSGYYNPRILYHGSPTEHDFTKYGDIMYGTFLSYNKNEASSYGKFLYEVTIKDNLNFLDTGKIEDCKKIIDKFVTLYDEYYSENEEGYEINTAEELMNSSDSWECIEKTSGVLDWAEYNYDGIFIYEGGCKNLLLFKPVKEKIVSIKLINETNERIIVKKFFEMSNFNYDYIVKALVREFNYGNTISDIIPEFEKSNDFKEVSDNESYITYFNKYLMYKNSKPNPWDNSLIVKEPTSWYSKST